MLRPERMRKECARRLALMMTDSGPCTISRASRLIVLLGRTKIVCAGKAALDLVRLLLARQFTFITGMRGWLLVTLVGSRLGLGLFLI